MLNTPKSLRGMVVSPHHLANQAGLNILREGGTAIEASVTMAATLAVVYPHMTGIGGDGFWLIAEPDGPVGAIDACGAAARACDLDLYARAGHIVVPQRGPLAANTVAGAVSGWAEALAISAEQAPSLPLSRLLADAIHYAENGVVVTAGGAAVSVEKHAELKDVPGYAPVFLDDYAPLREGAILKQPALARTLRRLAEFGLDDFYRGALADDIAADLTAAGSPVGAVDLAVHQATRPTPLAARIGQATVFNTPPPTQGAASLLILSLFDRLEVQAADGFDHVHGLVEATKQAFLYRDRHIGDPRWMSVNPQDLLDDPVALVDIAGRIDYGRAAPWPQPPAAGDTVWFGAIDAQGRAASVIQSTYFEFGSGVVLPQTGITWQNRGSSFRLTQDGWNALKPGRKPFHTLNPALARFDDGRTLIYGTMGGEGQPQTQAAIFTRYARFGQALQTSVTAPRWLLGRTWGADSVTLKIESRFDPTLYEALRRAGHDVELMGSFTSMMGHAGAIARHPSGVIEGAADPRSDGAVAAW